MPSRRNRTNLAVLVIAVAVLLAAAGAAAQQPPEQQPPEQQPPEQRPSEQQPSEQQPPEQQTPKRTRIVSANFGMQFINDAFMNRVTFQQHGEASSFESHYDVTKHYALDGGIAFLLWKGLGLGLAAFHVAEPTTARVDALIPHPHFSGFPRRASGVRIGLTRRETGLHVQGQYWWFIDENFLLRAVWGPTFFMARQDLVEHIDSREANEDFDQLLLTGHRARTVSAGSLGLNLGFDGTWFLTERVGLGFNVRYSRGTATVRLGGRAATPLELGGTHAGGGLRLAF